MTSFFRNNNTNNAGNSSTNKQQQQKQTKLSKQFGDDYPFNNSATSAIGSLLIRSSPDRASVGAVQRRREHVRKLAEIARVDQQQDTSTTTENRTTGTTGSEVRQHYSYTNTSTATNWNDGGMKPTQFPNNQNRPYGVQGAFWTHPSSSNLSVASSPGTNSSVASYTTSTLLNNLEDDPFWETKDTNGFSFTGMVVKPKKKKKSTDSTLLSEALKRRTQMKLMAEEAAAVSLAAGRSYPAAEETNTTTITQKQLLVDDDWEAFPSSSNENHTNNNEWGDPSFFNSHRNNSTTNKPSYAQSDVGDTTFTRSSFYNNNRRPPLASPQQQQQQHNRSTSNISSTFNASSFIGTIGKQDPPPLTIKRQQHKQQQQEQVKSPETISSSSTTTSNNSNGKDLRKDRISQVTAAAQQLHRQHKPSSLEQPQKLTPLVFDAFGINDEEASATEHNNLLQQIDRCSPTSSLNTDVPNFHHPEASTDCANTADLWAPSSKTTGSTSSTSTNDDTGRRNPFKELAGTFQKKHREGILEHPTFSTTARSEVGIATTTKSSTIAKNAWRNRNSTPIDDSMDKNLPSAWNSSHQPKESAQLSDTDTTILPEAAALSRTRSSPTSDLSSLHKAEASLMFDNNNNRALPWRRKNPPADPSPIEQNPSINTSNNNNNIIPSALPWRMRLQEMKRQQQQEASQVETLSTLPNNSPDKTATPESLTRSSSLGNLARHDAVPPIKSQSEMVRKDQPESVKTNSNLSTTHVMSVSRSSSWSNVNDVPQSILASGKTNNYRARRPLPVNTTYSQHTDSESNLSLVDHDDELPTLAASPPNSSASFSKIYSKQEATTSTERKSLSMQNRVPSNQDNGEPSSKSASFLNVKLKKTGSLDVLLNPSDQQKKEVAPEAQLEDKSDVVNTILPQNENNDMQEAITTTSAATSEEPEEKLYDTDCKSSADVEGAPHDVAALIRKRISMNKNKKLDVNVQQESSSSVGNSLDTRSRFRASTPSSTAVDTNIPYRRSRPPTKIDTTALRNLKEEHDTYSQRMSNKDDEATICDSVLATVNGGENDTETKLQSPNDLSPRGSLRNSLQSKLYSCENQKLQSLSSGNANQISTGILASSDQLNNTTARDILNRQQIQDLSLGNELLGAIIGKSSAQASLPDENLIGGAAQTLIDDKQVEKNQLQPHRGINVGQVDVDDSISVHRASSPNSSIPTVDNEAEHADTMDMPRRALHEALMKRTSVFHPQEDKEKVSSKQHIKENSNKYFDDNEAPPTMISKKDALHAALLNRVRSSGNATDLNLPSVVESKDMEKATQSTVELVAQPPNDHTLGKYFKMLKMGLPLEAVHHAMKKDGLDSSMLKAYSAPVQPASAAPDTATSHKPDLLAAEKPSKIDPKYEKYFKMLKIGIPLEAVKHSVVRDGLDPSVLDGTQSKKPVTATNMIGSAAAAVKAAFQIQKKTKDTVRRMRIHWETMNHASVPVNSVWAMLNADPDVEEIQIDESEFKALFQADNSENNSASRMGKLGLVSEKRAGVVKVIEPKRANNGGIILARVKMGFDKVAKAIERL